MLINFYKFTFAWVPCLFLLALVAQPARSHCQILPTEGSTLNHRIIGFSFPGKEHAANRQLQMATGNCTTPEDFESHRILSIEATTNRTIAEVPSFGCQYTWRIVEGRSKKQSAEFHHFSTGMASPVDTGTRCRIITPATRHTDCFVFSDVNKALYDMSGKPVWFFPSVEGRSQSTFSVRDLHTSDAGTITAIVNGRIYELSFNGNILWRGPDNNQASLDTLTPDHGYHHEFIRTAGGHYMAMSFEEPWWLLPKAPDSNAFAQFPTKLKRSGDSIFQKMFFANIIEYDQSGNIVWKWSSGDYLRHSDLRDRMFPNGMYNINNIHGNAFYFDEAGKTLLISFRDINRIIQISYPDGKVLHTYGESFSADDANNRRLLNGAFCGQHSCRLASDGDLYLFNNNSCNRKAQPSVEMLKTPPRGKDTIEKIREFTLPLEPGEQVAAGTFGYGGNVTQLDSGDLFVCMGGIYGKLLIVGPDDKICWSAQPEKWDTETAQWRKDGALVDHKMREGSYRAHLITRKQLEQLIWAGE